jgi:hypothetical protein
MVGAPNPDVIDQDVVAVDFERDISLADVRTTNTELHMGQSRRIRRVVVRATVVAVLLSDLQKYRRFDCAHIDRDTDDNHPGHVCDRERDRTLDCGERSVSHAQDNRVHALDGDALPDVVNAGSEQ